MKFSLGLLLSLLTCGVAHAESWTAGVGNDKSFHYAATTNDSDGLFGQYCYVEDESCYWLVAIKTSCEINASTPIVMASDDGARHVSLICRGPYKLDNGQTLYRYYLDNFDFVDSAVRGSKLIGFAMPLESGRFRVSRFDLQGAVPVIDSMRSRVQTRINRKPTKSSKDQIL